VKVDAGLMFQELAAPPARSCFAIESPVVVATGENEG